MDNIEKKTLVENVQEFVSEHKVAIAICAATVVTATFCILIQRSAIRDWNNFLHTEGLTDKFYRPEL